MPRLWLEGLSLAEPAWGWKTNKLFSFKITLVPREAEMPSHGVRTAQIHEAGEKDRFGQPWPQHAQRSAIPVLR